jgi:hypothetical protein
MRRLVYFGAGAVAALWARRRLALVVERYTPTSVRDSAVERARRLGDDVRAAVSDGRAAMAARQNQLRGDGSVEPSWSQGAGPALRLVEPPVRHPR